MIEATVTERVFRNALIAVISSFVIIPQLFFFVFENIDRQAVLPKQG